MICIYIAAAVVAIVAIVAIVAVAAIVVEQLFCAEEWEER